MKSKIYESLSDLKLLKTKPCTKEEETQYDNMLKNGEPLPEVRIREYTIGDSSYKEVLEKDIDLETLDLLIKIKTYQSIRGIKTILIVLLVMALIASTVSFVAGVSDGFTYY